MLLNQRRASDHVAGQERFAAPHRCRQPAVAFKVSAPFVQARCSWWPCRAARDFLQRRLFHHTGHGAAQTDDLGLLVGRAAAVAFFVCGVESALQRTLVAALEGGERHVHRHRMFLSGVAHVECAVHHHLARAEVGLSQRRQSLLFHLRKPAFEIGHRYRAKTDELRAHQITAEVRQQHAEGREVPRRARHDHARNAQLARHHRGVQRAGATVGEQGRELAGVEAAVGGDALDCVRHRSCRNAQNTQRSLSHRQPQRRGDFLLECAFGGGLVEQHFAAEKMLCIEAAQHQVGVSDGRFGAAESVAHRPGRSARALRPDAQRA